MANLHKDAAEKNPQKSLKSYLNPPFPKPSWGSLPCSTLGAPFSHDLNTHSQNKIHIKLNTRRTRFYDTHTMKADGEMSACGCDQLRVK